MAVTIDWGTFIIHVPKADLTLIQSVPTEILEMDINWFRIQLKDIEDNEEGIPFLKTHTHNTEVLLGGLTYARVVEILAPYTITFEDSQYAVNLVGANSNIGDRVNVNQVSVRSSNSAGLTSAPEIQYGLFQNKVTINVVDGEAGTGYPLGTATRPVNNLTDALTIATSRGFKTIHVIGNLTIESIPDGTLDGFTFEGQGTTISTITINDNQLIRCTFKDCTLTGTFTTGSVQNLVYDCVVGNITNLNFDAKNSILTGTIILNSASAVNLYNCIDGVSGSETPIVELNECTSLGIWGYSGGIKLTNIITVGTNISFNAPSGRLIVDSTDTQGSIIARGVGSISGTTGGTTITQTDLLNRDTISDSVWGELTVEHTTAGTTGKALSDAGAAGNPWGSPVEGNTAAGTFGELVGNKLLTVAKFLGLK